MIRRTECTQGRVDQGVHGQGTTYQGTEEHTSSGRLPRGFPEASQEAQAGFPGGYPGFPGGYPGFPGRLPRQAPRQASQAGFPGRLPRLPVLYTTAGFLGYSRTWDA